LIEGWLKLTVITSTMGLIPAIAAPIPAYEPASESGVSMRSSPNSSKTFACKAPPYRLRLPHQENTLIMLRATLV
jgi:hypothetical protein